MKNPWNTDLDAHAAALENSPAWQHIPEPDERKGLFEKYVRSLREERLQLFRKQLTKAGLGGAPTFAEAQTVAAEHRMLKDVPEEDLRDEYARWREREQADAKHALLTWLQASYNSNWKDIPDHGRGFDVLVRRLEEDVRYQRLKFMGPGREDLVRGFLQQERANSQKRAETRNIKTVGEGED